MCVRSREINIYKPYERNNDWKIPKYMIKDWDTKTYSTINVKCGVCHECKNERGRNWTYKIFLEALDHEEKCFITLTYRDNKQKQLNKKHLQDFIKRLRQKTKKTIKFFSAGEYGEKKGRPHYHIIIMGYQPNDLERLRGKQYSNKGHKMYDSEEIKKLWGHGRISVQKFHYKEIAYLTLYLNQNEKINKYHNKNDIKRRKKAINELKVKYDISIKTKTKGKKQKIIYNQIRRIKDIDKLTLYNYKKEYEEINKNMRYTIEPEFNTWSNNMGFESYIKRQYYKYDFIIDNKKYEIPKEYLRKVIDNKKYHNNEELYKYTIYHNLERKQYVEEERRKITQNYLIEYDNMERGIIDERIRKQINDKEIEAINKNEINIKLKKIIMSDF